MGQPIGQSLPLAVGWRSAFATGKRSAELLGRLKDWMAQHNAVIMAVLCLVIGDALGGLTA